jgi:hypothetical protein
MLLDARVPFVGFIALQIAARVPIITMTVGSPLAMGARANRVNCDNARA